MDWAQLTGNLAAAVVGGVITAFAQTRATSAVITADREARRTAAREDQHVVRRQRGEAAAVDLLSRLAGVEKVLDLMPAQKPTRPEYTPQLQDRWEAVQEAIASLREGILVSRRLLTNQPLGECCDEAMSLARELRDLRETNTFNGGQINRAKEDVRTYLQWVQRLIESYVHGDEPDTAGVPRIVLQRIDPDRWSAPDDYAALSEP